MKKLLLQIIISFIGISCAFSQDHFAHQDTIRIIKFSPEGSYILTSGDDDMVRMWDVKEGRMLHAFKHGYDIKKIFIHPSGSYMVTSDAKSSTCIWDLEEGKVLKCMSGQNIEGFTPDGKSIIVVDYGNDGKRYASLSFVSPSTYEKKTFPTKIYTEGEIGKIFFFKSDPNFLIAQDKNMLELNPDKGNIKEKFSMKNKQEFLAVSGDQKLYTFAGDKQLYDFKKNKKAVDLQEPMKSGHGSYFWFTDDSKNLVSVFQKEITLFETDSGKVVKKYYPDGYMYSVTEDLKLIAVSEQGKDLKLKRLESGELLFNYVAEDLVKRTGYQNYLKGIKSFQEEDYKRAIDFFTKSLGTIGDKDVYSYRGKAYYLTGKYEKAIDDFLNDEKRNPGRSLLDLSKAYAALGNTKKSIHYLKKHLNSSYREQWTKIEEDKAFQVIQEDTTWQAFVQQQVISEAEQLALSAEGNLKRKDYRNALSLLSTAIANEPSNPNWYNLRAKAHLELGHYADAVTDYKKELSLDPKRKNQVYKNIAIVFARKGELKRSAVFLSEIVRSDSSQFYLLLDIAEIELERYDREKALEAVNTYLNVLPDDDEAYYIKANIADGEEAKRYIQKAIELCKAQNKKVPKEYQDLLKTFI